ncbi:MAG: hypothetical protein IKH77_06210 [Clostridia bacterium]|nr:hypothetical protein [Clostridia bacterium]
MLKRYLEPFTRLVPVAVPDGLGGAEVTWQEGERLYLAASPLPPREEQAEGRALLRRRLRLYLPLGEGETRLTLGDWLLRECTGERLRVTGDTRLRRTPRRARAAYGICEAEVTAP